MPAPLLPSEVEPRVVKRRLVAGAVFDEVVFEAVGRP